MMPFALFEQAALAVPYQYKFPRFLYSLVRLLRPMSVVEVGSHIGATAVWLARALQENGDGGQLHCIDSFCWVDEPTQRQQWKDNVMGCGFPVTISEGKEYIPDPPYYPFVRLIVGRSQEVEWPTKVDFAYIDANHTYAACKHDTEKAISLGATLVAMHDTVSCEGVKRFAEEFRTRAAMDTANYSVYGHGDELGWDILEENSESGLMICKKREPKPAPVQGDFDHWDKG